MAYNEEENISHAIHAILAEPLTSGDILEVVVVASGCSDRTTEIVAELARHEPRVKLIVQEHRAGKASAINLFISAARAPVLVMVNGDNIVGAGSLDALVRHFHDRNVGMVGGHPMPVNDQGTFLGYAVHLVWLLHDRIARDTPKLGELVAFRNVVSRIPVDTAVDEISIQAIITELGLALVYEPAAVVFNRGPGTLRDFLAQRRRIYAGHLRIARNQGYSASTMSVTRVGRALVQSEVLRIVQLASWLAGTVMLEGAARTLGWYDVLVGRSHHVWSAITSTKTDIVETLTQTQHNVARRDTTFAGARAASLALYTPRSAAPARPTETRDRETPWL
jgi:hypothetical protein